MRHAGALLGALFSVSCGGALVEPTAEMRLGETQKFVATADVTLHEGTNHQGAEPNCLARGGARDKLGLACLMRWTLPETRVSIASAWLELYVLNSSPFTFDLYPALANWSETDGSWTERAPGLPWQTAGAKGAADRGPKLGELTAPAEGNATYVFDARGRALLESWLEDPATHRGIVIASETSYDGIGIASREDPNAEDRPTLVIQVGRAGGPVPDARRSD